MSPPTGTFKTTKEKATINTLRRMGKNGKLGKKSQLDLAAKKCCPIGNYFVRKISAKSGKYPLDVFVDDNGRKPSPETTGGGDVTPLRYCYSPSMR